MLRRVHAKRLREMYRSAGWPFQDIVEVELLAAGLLERVVADTGHECVRVTDVGIACLADTAQLNRNALSKHEALVEQVAERLGQESISVYCPERNEGTVIGPGAEKWLPFTIKRFRRYDDDLNVPLINTFDPCLGEDAQQMHDRLTPKELTLQPDSKQRLEKLLKSKETAFDPIENAIRAHPGLTRGEAERHARAAGF